MESPRKLLGWPGSEVPRWFVAYPGIRAFACWRRCSLSSAQCHGESSHSYPGHRGRRNFWRWRRWRQRCCLVFRCRGSSCQSGSKWGLLPQYSQWRRLHQDGGRLGSACCQHQGCSGHERHERNERNQRNQRGSGLGLVRRCWRSRRRSRRER